MANESQWPMEACELDEDLKDPRPDKGETVLVPGNSTLRSGHYAMTFDAQTGLLTIKPMREPGSGFAAPPELTWMVPVRHVRWMAPKPEKS